MRYKPIKKILLLSFFLGLTVSAGFAFAQETDKDSQGVSVDVLNEEESLVPVELSMWDLKVEKQTFASVNVTWKTSKDADQCVHYGYTKDNLEFEICSTEMSKEHNVLIGNLSMGTVYFFKANSRDDLGNQVEQGPFTFTTLLQQIELPEVENVQTEFVVSGLILRWTNPDTEDFGGVIVVKKIGECPRTVVDGQLIYQGSGRALLDKNIEYGTDYCYALFTYNFAGNVSTGTTTGKVSIGFWQYVGLIITSNWWLFLLLALLLWIIIYDVRRKYYVYVLSDDNKEFLKLGITRNIKKEVSWYRKNAVKIDGGKIILRSLIYCKTFVKSKDAQKEAKLIDEMNYSGQIEYIKKSNSEFNNLAQEFIQ